MGAHDEVTELYESTRETLHKVHEEQNGHLIGFKCDLTAATEKVYNKLSADKTAQANIIASMTESLDTAAAATAAELQDAKDLFASRELTLANAIVTLNSPFSGGYQYHYHSDNEVWMSDEDSHNILELSM